jgi:hypothetical protein
VYFCGRMYVIIGARLPLIVLLLTPVATPLGAQALRADLTVMNRHLWRGINRTSDWVGQLQLAAVAPLGRGAFAVGVFESRQLRETRPGNLTEVGQGKKGLGERNWWVEYRRPVGILEIFAGATRFTFHGDSQLGGRPPADNTTEISFGLQAKVAYLSPALAAHIDVDRVDGLYLEASAAVPLLGWPYPPPLNLYVDGSFGLNLGQGPDARDVGELAHYAGDGFTHLAVGLSVDLHQSELFTTGSGVRIHVGMDDQAHLGSNGRRRNLFFTYWLGTTLRPGRLST